MAQDSDSNDENEKKKQDQVRSATTINTLNSGYVDTENTEAARKFMETPLDPVAQGVATQRNEWQQSHNGGPTILEQNRRQAAQAEAIAAKNAEKAAYDAGIVARAKASEERHLKENPEIGIALDLHSKNPGDWKRAGEKFLAQNPYDGQNQRTIQLPPGTELQYVDPTHIRLKGKSDASASVVVNIPEGVANVAFADPLVKEELKNSYERVMGAKLAESKRDAAQTAHFLKKNGVSPNEIPSMEAVLKQAQAAVSFKGQNETAATMRNSDYENLGELSKQNLGADPAEKTAGRTTVA